MHDDGTMMRMGALLEFAAVHGFAVGTIADLIAYRLAHDTFVTRVASAKLPTAYGEFVLHGFEDALSGSEHVALTIGTVDDGAPVLVRMHSECLTGDALHSLRCDCGAQRDAALAAISAEGRGVLVYLRQEGRGIGLLNKIRAYALQDGDVDTVEANLRLDFAADLRDYGVGAQILHSLGVQRLRLLTNNPRKVAGLSGYAMEIVERVPLHAGKNPHNERYLATKVAKLGHLED
jgi:3,4-dihydroxy 2-butanone 4-phosphate synthase/GTP cyclohydrolase II